MDTQSTLDDFQLLRVGKKPVVKRKFGKISIFGLACIVIGQWNAVTYTFQIGYTNGGPAGLIYGFLVAWAGTLATFCSLAELASMAPVSAGQYHWISILAPRSSQKLLSYVTGWLTVLGWQAGVAGAAFACADLVITFIQIVSPSYRARLWHATLLYYAVIALAVLATAFSSSSAPRILSASLVLYVFGFLAVIVPLVSLSRHGSAPYVFTRFQNVGGWPTEGLSFMIGLSGVAFDFCGADCIYHMSEEVLDAQHVVPAAMIIALGVGGCVGLGSLLSLLFSIDEPEMITNSRFEYPFASIFLHATKSVAGSAVMTMIITLLQMAGVIGLLAAASRMLWAFARDRGVPGWRYIGRVNSRTSIPQISILVTASFSVLVGLISIGSPLAFNDLLSLSVSALYGSYFAACSLLFWRRITGKIRSTDEDSRYINLPGSEGRLVWGPWRIRGTLGKLINGFACIYLITIFFFLFWPTATPVTASTMNYSVVLFIAVATLSATYYWLWARQTFEGPLIETDSSINIVAIEAEQK